MKIIPLFLILLVSTCLRGGELRIADAIPGGDAPIRQLALRQSLAGKQQIQYRHATVSSAFAELAKGNVEIVVAELLAQPKEFKGKIQIYAVDSLVFYVNIANTLEEAKTPQLRDIFTLKQPNWQNYSFLSADIQRYGVKPGKPGAERMAHFLIRGSQLAQNTRFFNSTAELLAMTGANPNAIGFGVYLSSTPAQVKLLSVDGVTPNLKSVSEATYPLAVKRAVFTAANFSEETASFLAE
ncbi:MAG: hypothetical protein LBM70_07505, partial [Victivallales bacterium]|nr:hypothetical protein [Victivallales bacterium]